ncbi:MAG: Mut7-C RNAse domain-containing protein [Desulfurococcaceae archaeon]
MSIEPRFIVDTMLGNVARWLRILGYDTVYRRDLKDWDIIRIAKREDRVVVTSDKSLHRKALLNGLLSIYIDNPDISGKLAYIAYITGIRLYVDLGRTKCPICNTDLVKVSKNNVENKVPRGVYRMYSDFWMCRKCGKIYWIGGHWVKIEEVLKNARRILEEYRLTRAKGAVTG